jgi:hypothetical protein
VTSTRALVFAALAWGATACSTPSTAPPSDAGGDVRDAWQDAPPDTGRPHDGGSPRHDAGEPRDAAAHEAGPTSASLTSLIVSSLTLVPRFSPDVYDYYVQCATGANAVSVSVKASTGATSSLSVETPGTPEGTLMSVGTTAPQQTLSLSLSPGQALVATATEGKASEEYWVRCLPPGFPPHMEWNTHPGARTPGYYLVGTLSVPPGDSALAIVFDTNGVPVWYEQNAYDSNGVYDVESLFDGGVSFGGGRWQVHTLGVSTTYPVVDAYDGGSPASPDEHELRILPNGHYLALASPGVLANLTGVTLPDPYSDSGEKVLGPNETILACQVQEFDPTTGNVVWEWTATQHFDPAKAWYFLGVGELTNNGYYEPFHCNAIDVDTSGGDANTGNIVVSARHMSSFFEIDKRTGKVLWMVGGAKGSSYDAPVYVPVDDPFVGQHDARLQPSWKPTCSGGSGQMSLFDDETDTTNAARAVVYDVIVNDGSGCAGGTTGTTGAKRSWQFKSPKHVPSNVVGSFRILADGSRTIGWGQSQPTTNGLVFSEVDDSGNDLLDFVCPDGSSSYRAVKVPLSQLDLNVLRLTSGS